MSATPTRGPGRPPRGDRHTFAVRLTPEEWEAWQAKATAHGVKFAELIRRGVEALPEGPG